MMENGTTENGNKPKVVGKFYAAFEFVPNHEPAFS